MALNKKQLNACMRRLRKHLRDEKVEVVTLDVVLRTEGQEGLVGKRFVGYDNDYGRLMVYRVDEYHQNGGHPSILISELTAHPRIRVYPSLNLDLHRRDIAVSCLEPKEAAEFLGLEIEHFHHYV